MQMCVFFLVLAAMTTVLTQRESEFAKLVKRIQEIRAAGWPTDSPHIMQDAVKITEQDYLLMGCDNAAARRNFPALAAAEREVGRWYAGALDLERTRFGNAHAHYDKVSDRWYVDTFYTTVPRPEYLATPEEVAWHFIRVRQLRQQMIPQAERVATMQKEALEKPWELFQ